MAMLKYVFCVTLLAVTLKNARAISKEDITNIYEKFKPHFTACSTELSIPEDDLKNAKEEKNVDGIDSCFYSCVFKKAELMDGDGKFNPEKALEKAKAYLNEEDLKNASEVMNECAKLNSEDVSECERAKQLTVCFLKSKEMFMKDE